MVAKISLPISLAHLANLKYTEFVISLKITLAQPGCENTKTENRKAIWPQEFQNMRKKIQEKKNNL